MTVDEMILDVTQATTDAVAAYFANEDETLDDALHASALNLVVNDYITSLSMDVGGLIDDRLGDSQPFIDYAWSTGLRARFNPIVNLVEPIASCEGSLWNGATLLAELPPLNSDGSFE